MVVSLSGRFGSALPKGPFGLISTSASEVDGRSGPVAVSLALPVVGPTLGPATVAPVWGRKFMV